MITRTPTRIGIIGGGQLARMMIPVAINLGLYTTVLAEKPGMSAAIGTTVVGDYRDLETVLAFAETVDIVTFDHEHVPHQILTELVKRGVVVRPGPHALVFAQDKILMRERLQELNIPIPEWAALTGPNELKTFLDDNGGAAVVKRPRGGYDGNGVQCVTNADAVADWFAEGAPLLAEERVQFRRELAQLIARRPSGEIVGWPLVETIQSDGVCVEVIAPAPGSQRRTSDLALTIASEIAEQLDVVGVLAVELFETVDDRLLVNELAMRPHNSGHWTIDGSCTSQFEQHLRAIADLPLGTPDPRDPWAVMVNVFGGPKTGSLIDRYPSALARHAGVKIHNYDKEPRPGRKIAHVTAVGADLDEVAYQARATAAFFQD